MDKQKNGNFTETSTQRINKLLLAALQNISDAKSILGNSEVSKLLTDAEIACIEAKELNSSLIKALSAGTITTNEIPQNEDEKMNELVALIKGSKILILEDEKPVADLLKAFLEKAGCTVKTFSEGKSVLNEYKKSIDENSKYDVIIIDLIVKGELSGVECLNAILELDPNANTILASGYCEAVDEVVKEKFRTVLSKPFTYGELIIAIAKTLQKI